MTDKERVVKGLEYCEKYFNCCDKCPYWDGGTHCTADLAHDALALLNEQEALPIVYETNKYTGLPVAHCPSCGEYLVQFHSGTDGKETKFCYYCGQAVKWDD